MTFAKRLVEACPHYRIVLADIRGHGRSLDAPLPDTLEACAADLQRLTSESGWRVEVVSGHSFGSKVAVEYARSAQKLGHPVKALWILDADPTAARASSGSEADRPDDVDRVLKALREVTSEQTEFERRSIFTGALEERGIAAPVAGWLATQLRLGGELYRFRLDLDRIETLLADYRTTDHWSAIESLSSTGRVSFFFGEESPVVSPSVRDRFFELGRLNPQACSVYEVKGARHWLHVDNLSGLVEPAETELKR